ncbi:MAG: molybdopterin-dependent oxidoreductase [Burkholderiaceae bacterium]|nr:molybdopterin-dependent oxidoreductase [Burkholderiaceae bacterium]
MSCTLIPGDITATHWGIVRPEFKHQKLIKLCPHEIDPRPSPVLSRLVQLPYCEARIKRPAVRESYLKDGVYATKKRGNENFIEVSWDEAFALVTKELDRVYTEYGPSAVYGRSYGWKSTGLVNSSITLLRRLLNLCGGMVQTVNSYSTASIATILPYVTGVSDPKSDSWDIVLEYSERIVFWGCDPLITNDVDWSTTIHNSYPYLEKLKKSQIQTISINPLKTETADYLSSQWIAPLPGTDCALMLAIIYELIATGIDRNFIHECVEGWNIFEAYVTGQSDNIAKSPEWAQQITGIKASQIRSLTHDLRTHRTKIMMGWGMQRRPYGEQFPWMGYALAVALGQIGLPGGGIGTNYHYSQGGCPANYGPRPQGIAEKVDPVRTFNPHWKGSHFIPVSCFADCFLNPGKTIDYNGTKVTYPDIKLVFWAGGNPFNHQPQTNKLQQAWSKPQTIIVADSVWSPTARHADIVLPSCTTFERSDISGIGTYTNDGLVAMKQLIAPQWESKSDYEIFASLAERLNIKEAFTENLDELGWIQRIYNETAQKGQSMGISFPTFDDFWHQGLLLYPSSEYEKKFVSFKEFRLDPKVHSLETESGKLQIFSPKIDSYHYPDCSGLPKYYPECKPQEALAFLSTKSRFRLHSQLDPVGQNTHREPCWIHPNEARKRGISQNDTVILWNQFGKLLAQADITDHIMEGAILVRHGAWFEPKMTETGVLDNHGCANVLTEDVPTSRLSCGNIASGGFVYVEKYAGQHMNSTIHLEPRITKNQDPDARFIV